MLSMIIAGVVWHYWIAVPLVVGVLLMLALSAVGYLRKVTYKKYVQD